MYTLFDAPVNQFSPPERIIAWLDHLRSQASRPEFQNDAENLRSLEDAVAEAQAWLEQSRAKVARGRGRPPSRPAV
ncbi:MAG TPA: hypothetical protein VF092_29140 [Longimicrobium sp.]